MKRVLSMLLVAAIFVSCFAMATVVQAEEKEFVIDGNLDVWYITDYDQYAEDDNNTYDFAALDPYTKDPENGNGVNFYDSPETSASVWTAYDDDYVYVYVKVWDDELLSYSLKDEVGSGYDTSMVNTGYTDSIEVWFDPDPNSQTHYADGTAKPESEILSGFHMNTPDPEQGDVQFRYVVADNLITDYHDKLKPGYDVSFAAYIQDPANLCTFTFTDEPRENEYTGDVVSSGYGLEVRFPRNDDDSKAFALNVACNNSAQRVEGVYALAIGNAWWLDYASATKILYNYEQNPFFTQSEEILANKTIQYTNSAANATGDAVVKAINKLPASVTDVDKDAVQAVADQYAALTDIQKGYVKANNYDVLADACATLGISLDGSVVTPTDPGSDPQPTPTPDEVVGVRGDVDGSTKTDAGDALMILKYAVGKQELTDAQKVVADLDGNSKIDAGDALTVLKIAVGKA